MTQRTLEQCKGFRIRLYQEMLKKHAVGDIPYTNEYRDEVYDQFCVLGLAFNQMVEEEPEKFRWNDGEREPMFVETPSDLTPTVRSTIDLYLGLSSDDSVSLVDLNDDVEEPGTWLEMAKVILRLKYNLGEDHD